MEQYRVTRSTDKKKHIGKVYLISILQYTWDIRVIDDFYIRNISVAGGICVVHNESTKRSNRVYLIYTWISPLHNLRKGWSF